MSAQKQSLKLQPEQIIVEFRGYLYEREKAASTIEKYMTDVRTFLSYLDMDYWVDKPKIMEYKEWLCKNYAPASVNSMLASLNQMLEFLGASSLKVKRIKIQSQTFLADGKEMSKEEYKRLLSAAREKSEQLAMGIETLAVTGARISELAYFTVENVKKGFVEIVNKGKHRTILLSDSLRRKLLYYAVKQEIKRGHIFITRNGRPKNRSNFWREMKALKESANVAGEKIFPHNLRHLFARLFYKQTKDLTGLADLLGHSSLDTTRIYTASSSRHYKKEIENMELLM